MNSYFEHASISQSSLKILGVNPSLFNNVKEPEMYFEEKKHFTIGSAVDFCLTQPEKEFSEEYHVSQLENKPSDTIKSIINQVFDIVLAERTIEEVAMITDYSYEVLEACTGHNYQPTYKEQTRVNKICEHYEYWEDLKLAFGKTVLSQEEATLIDSIVMSIRTNETCSKYFNAKDVKFQVPIYFQYEDVDCKALLDMVIFDHENMVIQPIDIKTMGDYTINFPRALRKRRYDIQAAYYTEALKWLYPEYQILQFKFIVESTIDVGTPLVYTINDTLLNIGKYGRPKTYSLLHSEKMKLIASNRLQEVKGFVQLIELYKYYVTNGFEVDQRVRESNSELTIDWSGII